MSMSEEEMKQAIDGVISDPEAMERVRASTADLAAQLMLYGSARVEDGPLVTEIDADGNYRLLRDDSVLVQGNLNDPLG